MPNHANPLSVTPPAYSPPKEDDSSFKGFLRWLTGINYTPPEGDPVHPWLSKTVGPSVANATQQGLDKPRYFNFSGGTRPEDYTKSTIRTEFPKTAGAATGVSEIADSLKTPMGVGALAAYAFVPAGAVAALLDAGFSVAGIKGVLDTSPEVYDAYKRGDSEEGTRLLMHGLGAAAMTVAPAEGVRTGRYKSGGGGLAGEEGFIRLTTKDRQGRVKGGMGVSGKDQILPKTYEAGGPPHKVVLEIQSTPKQGEIREALKYCREQGIDPSQVVIQDSRAYTESLGENPTWAKTYGLTDAQAAAMTTAQKTQHMQTFKVPVRDLTLAQLQEEFPTEVGALLKGEPAARYSTPQQIPPPPQAPRIPAPPRTSGAPGSLSLRPRPTTAPGYPTGPVNAGVERTAAELITEVHAKRQRGIPDNEIPELKLLQAEALKTEPVEPTPPPTSAMGTPRTASGRRTTVTDPFKLSKMQKEYPAPRKGVNSYADYMRKKQEAPPVPERLPAPITEPPKPDIAELYQALIDQNKTLMEMIQKGYVSNPPTPPSAAAPAKPAKPAKAAKAAKPVAPPKVDVAAAIKESQAQGTKDIEVPGAPPKKAEKESFVGKTVEEKYASKEVLPTSPKSKEALYEAVNKLENEEGPPVRISMKNNRGITQEGQVLGWVYGKNDVPTNEIMFLPDKSKGEPFAVKIDNIQFGTTQVGRTDVVRRPRAYKEKVQLPEGGSGSVTETKTIAPDEVATVQERLKSIGTSDALSRLDRIKKNLNEDGSLDILTVVPGDEAATVQARHLGPTKVDRTAQEEAAAAGEVRYPRASDVDLSKVPAGSFLREYYGKELELVAKTVEPSEKTSGKGQLKPETIKKEAEYPKQVAEADKTIRGEGKELARKEPTRAPGVFKEPEVKKELTFEERQKLQREKPSQLFKGQRLADIERERELYTPKASEPVKKVPEKATPKEGKIKATKMDYQMMTLYEKQLAEALKRKDTKSAKVIQTQIDNLKGRVDFGKSEAAPATPPPKGNIEKTFEKQILSNPAIVEELRIRNSKDLVWLKKAMEEAKPKK